MDFSVQTRIAIFTLCLVAIVSSENTALLQGGVDQDLHLTTTELLKKYGYDTETHTVKTADGYILEMHRIPGDGPVVFLQHGLLSSSADWVVMGPGKSLAYILADAGYDVWMGNARGNTYSRKHVRLAPSDRDFWEFSWHEMGVYDLPAEIDYVLENTKKDQLYYIGHSMGTTMFYVMASELPAYNSKIRAMFSLAPIAYMSHMTSPFLRLVAMADDWFSVFGILNLIGMYEFLPSNKLFAQIGQMLCNDKAITQAICSNVLFLIAGYDSKELNSTMIPVIIGHTPAGASTREFSHYGQGYTSGRFCKFDHGRFKNMELYGTYSPPDYNVSRITAPVALHYSQNDWLSHVKDVAVLASKLPNLIGRFLVPDKDFNHLDYLYAIHAKEKVYDKVLNLMKIY